MIAQVTGLKAGKFHHYINNAHIYENHFDGLRTQLTREVYLPQAFWINPKITNFHDFTPNDVKLIDYKHHPKIEWK
ncbi:thymidylate synthase [Brevibacillus laterosporus]|uniref:thymidylate synthase n=1 Tax=Brevibacillus laterosporus TaxID=1465 RepID=UPI0035A6D102